MLSRLRTEAVVLPGFLSQAEEDTLARELEPQLRRRRYEYDHWDAVSGRARGGECAHAHRDRKGGASGRGRGLGAGRGVSPPSPPPALHAVRGWCLGRLGQAGEAVVWAGSGGAGWAWVGGSRAAPVRDVAGVGQLGRDRCRHAL